MFILNHVRLPCYSNDILKADCIFVIQPKPWMCNCVLCTILVNNKLANTETSKRSIQSPSVGHLQLHWLKGQRKMGPVVFVFVWYANGCWPEIAGQCWDWSVLRLTSADQWARLVTQYSWLFITVNYIWSAKSSLGTGVRYVLDYRTG